MLSPKFLETGIAHCSDPKYGARTVFVLARRFIMNQRARDKMAKLGGSTAPVSPTPGRPTPVSPPEPNPEPAPVSNGFRLKRLPKRGPLDVFRRHFRKYIEVFGVTIVAARGVPDRKVLHAANVMAQYLDNDEDGIADNGVACWLATKKAVLVMPDD